jgi:GABA(A) receptor-associated protein
MSTTSFKKSFSYEQRLKDATTIKRKYPARIPIIVEENKDVPRLSKHKYLAPCDLTVGEFLHILRKRIDLGPEQALFIFFNNGFLAPIGALLGAVYESNHDADQFLYALLCRENTFG